MRCFESLLALSILLAFAAMSFTCPQQMADNSEVTAEYDRGSSPANLDYLLLATNKTSTMRKEMNEAADSGYRFEAVMGGDTSFGGSEVVVVMSRPEGSPEQSRYRYQLLATSKTSTMQKEIQEAADAGFIYKGQTVFKSTFGGDEVVVILERDLDAALELYEYKLLATKKTGTMQKELREAGSEGYQFVGFTVSKTRFGGSELVTILRRPVQ